MILSSVLVALYLHDFDMQQRNALPALSHVEQTTQLSGALKVEVSGSDQVTAIAAGSYRVPMLQLLMTASCTADVKIETIHLRRRGLGVNADIEALYATSGNERISRATAISNKDGTVDLRLDRFVIPACESQRVIISADFAAGAAIAGEHQIILDGSNPVASSNATVTVSQAQTTAVRRTAGQSQGQLVVSYLPVLNRIQYGKNRTVSRIRLAAEGQSNHLLQAIRFTNRGSAHDSQLTNLYLESSAGERLSSAVAKMDGDSVYITLTKPLLLQRGENRTFVLRADVNGRAKHTVQFVIEEPSDVVATATKRLR